MRHVPTISVTASALVLVVLVSLLFRWMPTAGVGAGVATVLLCARYLSRRYRSAVSAIALTAVCVLCVTIPTIAIVSGSIHISPLNAAVAGYLLGLIGLWGLIIGVSTLGFALNAIVAVVLVLLFATAAAGWLIGHPTTLIGFLFAGMASAVLIYTGSIVGRSSFSDRAAGIHDDPIAVTVEFFVVALTAATVPFVARAISLFSVGGVGGFVAGLFSVPLAVLFTRQLARGVDLSRLEYYHEQFVQTAIEFGAEINGLFTDSGGSHRTHTDPTEDVERAGKIVAAAPVNIPTAHQFLDDAQSSLVGGRPLTAAAAAFVATSLVGRVPPTEQYLTGTSRFMEALKRHAGELQISTIDLGDARAAAEAGNEEEARSMTEHSLAMAISESSGLFDLVVQRIESAQQSTGTEAFAETLARLEAALALATAHELSQYTPERATETIQDLLSRLTKDHELPPITTSREGVTAAAGTGWDAVRRGDRLLTTDDLLGAAGAYTIAIESYVLALRAAAEGGFDTDAKRIRTALSILLDEQAAVLYTIATAAYTVPEPVVEDAGSTDERLHTKRERQTLAQGLTAIRTVTKQTGIQSEGVRSVRLFVRYNELRRRLKPIEQTLDSAVKHAKRGEESVASELFSDCQTKLENLSDRAVAAGLSEAAGVLSAAAVRCAKHRAAINDGRVDDLEPISIAVAQPAEPREFTVTPIGDELRRTLADERLDRLCSLLQTASTHDVRDSYDGSTAGKVQSMSTVISGMDPLFGTPPLDGLEALTRDVLKHALLSAITSIEAELATIHTGPVPDGFVSRPSILAADPIGDLTAAASLQEFASVWRESAMALANASTEITPATNAVQAFLTQQETIETKLTNNGTVTLTDISAADPIAVLKLAGMRIDGAVYNSAAETLSYPAQSGS